MTEVKVTDISFFDYDLPEELIAQNPCESRVSSRLLVVGGTDLPGAQAAPSAGPPSGASLSDKKFNDIVELLEPGSVIVFNDTEVFPARLRARRATGGKVEVLLTRQLVNPSPGFLTGNWEGKGECKTGGEERVNGNKNGNQNGNINKNRNENGKGEVLRERPSGGCGVWCEYWQAMIKPAKRLKKGECLELLGSGGVTVRREEGRIEIGDKVEGGEINVKLVGNIGRWESGFALSRELGETPLPPYIRRPFGESETDRERYQTVYARVPGAVAAPTAGLHFSRELLKRIQQRGVKIAYVTLHVGPGTFRPIKTQSIAEHVMHSERFHLSEETASVINRVRDGGGSVVAVGTTTVRVLESCADARGCLMPQSGDTRLFIYPGFKFRVVDGLVTNFHLPRSSLLLLVAAFAGEKIVLRAYEHAVRQCYRFYSYGDAMFLFKEALE